MDRLFHPFPLIFIQFQRALHLDGEIIELILVGNDIDNEYLGRKVKQAEELAGRSVSCVVLDPSQADVELKNFNSCDLLPLWNCNGQKKP